MSISDRNVLNAVKTLLSRNIYTKTDWCDNISEEARAEIEQGLAETDRGEVTPHEEVMEKYKNMAVNLYCGPINRLTLLTYPCVFLMGEQTGKSKFK